MTFYINCCESRKVVKKEYAHLFVAHSQELPPMS